MYDGLGSDQALQNWDLSDKLGYTGLNGVNPKNMSIEQFNTWAFQNPEQASLLGDTGFDASSLGAESTTDWSIKGLGGTLLGAGQLGLGALSYFDQKKTADAQRKLMGQQYATNKYVIDKQKEDSASLAKAFGTV